MFISYAQNFEDVMLFRALKHVDKGVYIDIGAQDPVVDSVSLAFYSLGWRGLHVEPTPQFAAKLRSARPDEEVVEAAVGAENGLLEIYEIKDTGLSTGKADIAERHRAAGFAVERRLVASIRLEQLLNHFEGLEIHWLKIDVEGMEKDVIEGWGQSPMRPWIVIVESTQPLSRDSTSLDWENNLVKLGYKFAFFDGLNRFYISGLHDELMSAFQAPPNVFDDFALGLFSTSTFTHLLGVEIEHTQADLEETRTQLALVTGQLAAANEQRSAVETLLDSTRAELTAANERLAAANAQHAAALAALAKMELAFGGARSRPLNNVRMYIRWKMALFWLRLSPLLSSGRVDRLIHRAWKYAPPGTFDEASAQARRHVRSIATSSADATPDLVSAPSKEQDRRLRGGGAKIEIAHAPRSLGRRLRGIAVAVAFHSDGKPRRLVRRTLFHSDGRVRGIFFRWVYHTRGTPRSLFSRWLAGRNAAKFSDASSTNEQSGVKQAAPAPSNIDARPPEAALDMNEEDQIVYARLRAARDYFARDS